MMTSRLRPLLAVVVASALILAIGGFAVASNMGFKLNKPIVFSGAGQVGRNWTSIPFNNPYVNAGGLCTQLGLTSAGSFCNGGPTPGISCTVTSQCGTGGTCLPLRATCAFLNENTGSTTQVSCGTAAANTTLLIAGKGVNIVQPNVAGAPTSVIIVGSHNPTLSLTVPKSGTGQVGNFWFSVPYHTTAVTAADLCNQVGMTSTGNYCVGGPTPGAPCTATSQCGTGGTCQILRGTINRLNAATGAFTQVTCGTAGAGTLNLVLGEQVQLREPLSAKTFLPAHY